MKLSRCVIGLWLWCLVGGSAIAQEQASSSAELSQLMAAFAQMPGLEARFVEEKHIGMLARPLSSQGRLYFAKPGFMLRRVEQPKPSEVLITPQQLKLKNADGEQSIDLAARPDVRPFVESLTWLLAGDHKALSAVYRVEFAPVSPPSANAQGDAGKAAGWRLTLTPKAEPLSHLIAYVRVIGSGFTVNEIQVREKGGDETVTRIVEANPARKFAPAELTSLFGIKSQTSPR
jgi:outer membrane lipoprotein-sorting protein